MTAHLRANLCLLIFTVLLCCVLYPLALWGIGSTLFYDKAQGSLVSDSQGKLIGSRLIAQPFTADEYFQPRPSATSPSYNAMASGPSNWAACNYLLRDRVARQLGPVAKYRGGSKKGQPVAPDIETWFQKDQFEGKPGIVALWANLHNAVAQNWVKSNNDPVSQKVANAYVAAWHRTHDKEVKQWIHDNPDPAEPKPDDGEDQSPLAVPFFVSFSKDHPGMFPSVVDHKAADGKTEKKVEPVKDGSDIQSAFFDMWLAAHKDADLEPVPADMVTASGSGLDPHITLANARWQLDRVAGAWAKKTGGKEAAVRGEIEQLLRDQSQAPLAGLFGVPLVNVLEVNLALKAKYEKPAAAK
jgi:K+-transporting ATPase ATPase C chain